MSIFKNTFSTFVKNQLETRQRIIEKRTPQGLQYLNSRNAWVRLSSSVDINNDDGETARKYILQGGTLVTKDNTLANVSLKAGLGSAESNAYSNTSNSGIRYQRGIRPTPGITSVDIKSKSAYGSLREAVVNFQCWDLAQLEDLEALYMRPGYTILLEWGWTPYVTNKETYNPNFTDYYNILKPATKDRQEIFKALYDKSARYDGNYDAMFGYIKNYSWNARQDGGYDCQVTIISTGEIIESIKVNYAAVDIDNINNTKGILNDEFKLIKQHNDTKWLVDYQKHNRLAGMWSEVYYKVTSQNYSYNESYKYIQNLFALKEDNSTDTLSKGDDQVYIKLDEVFHLIEKYIVAKDQNKKPLLNLSLNQNGYDGVGGSLYCLAHHLQISADPTVCLINNCLWTENPNQAVKAAATNTQNDPAFKTATAASARIIVGFEGTVLDPTLEEKFVEGVKLIDSIETLSWVDKNIKDQGEYNSLVEAINGEFEEDDIQYVSQIYDALSAIPNIQEVYFEYVEAVKDAGGRSRFNRNYSTDDKNAYVTFKQSSFKDITFVENSFRIKYVSDVDVNAAISITTNITSALANIGAIIGTLDNFFQEPELGIIKNIYVNVNFLYKAAIDSNIQSADKKEKNDINLYAYLKKIASSIQEAIGNVNSFEIHVDPIDNTARIIDVNYTAARQFKNLYELEIQSLKSIVRSYTLQSQIFPEQSSLVAIGAQARGGSIGSQVNTFIDFNRSLTDRIITEKLDGSGEPTEKIKYNIRGSLADIIIAYSQLNKSVNQEATVDSEATVDMGSLFASAKNSLKDLIIYIQSITKSSSSLRNIIPTKFSFEIDGIGGLVIGHMFRLPKNNLPKGYKGEGFGTEIGQIITGIGHTLSKGDWVTKIDALSIVLEDIDKSAVASRAEFNSLSLGDIIKGADVLSSGNASTSVGVSGNVYGGNFGNTLLPDDPKDIWNPNQVGNIGYVDSEIAKDMIAKKYENAKVEESKNGIDSFKPIPDDNILSGDNNWRYKNGRMYLHPQAALVFSRWQQAINTLVLPKGFTITILVASAYRNYEHQIDVSKDAPQAAAAAGTSPHGWGGAVDVTFFILKSTLNEFDLKQKLKAEPELQKIFDSLTKQGVTIAKITSKEGAIIRGIPYDIKATPEGATKARRADGDEASKLIQFLNISVLDPKTKQPRKIRNYYELLVATGQQYEWYNPWGLSDGAKRDEGWHFEYWPKALWTGTAPLPNSK